MSHYSRSRQSIPDDDDDNTIRPSTHRLRIGFIHPDLGIGGAERLVVDAAVGLKELGHHVEVFTSWHEPGRCFEETRDGTIPVHVLGNSIFPRSIAGKFHTLFAILRQFHLALSLILSIFLSYLPIPFLIPINKPFASSADWSPRRKMEAFDVFIVDQLSACVPLLRWGGRTRVVFYCHFPDLLLSQGKNDDGTDGRPSSGGLKALYRIPLDWLEETTTGEADKILVNSEFTSGVFRRTFKSLHRQPRCVYPGVNPAQYLTPDSPPNITHVTSDRPTVLSINRFEDKKDIGLAIEAFAILRKSQPSNPTVSTSRLVLCGGYDSRVSDNVKTLKSLQRACTGFSLSYHVLDDAMPSPTGPVDVLFIPNTANSTKLALLTASSTRVLLYTPSNEHLGIVPLEAMASGLPVLAVDSGGPKETLVSLKTSPSTGTGLLCPPIPEEWAAALGQLLLLSDQERVAVADSARRRVREMFSLEVMAKEMEKACRETVDMKRCDQTDTVTDLWLEERMLKTLMVSLVPIIFVCAASIVGTVYALGRW